MPLQPHTRLGAYEIQSALGAGGMGEVYRAKDSKLGRAVAIKVLPDTFLNDPERLARFQREAQLLAALNHPHIAGIHGFEEANGLRFLVLELVDGESLAARLERGPIPVYDALAIARQIADAVEAAHEKGIIHRDLKPANIMVTPDNDVKVLDFGLAKLLETEESPDILNSPTRTSAATRDGVILGTAAYMAPEQAKGRAADKRSDVWAFGCVLYEMLTAKRAFEGDSVSDTLAAILRGEPDWGALPASTPGHIRTLVTRCLAKDRKARIPDLSVARYLLSDTGAAPLASSVPASSVPLWRRAIPLGISGLVAAGLTLAAVRALHSPTPLRVTRFSMALDEGQNFSNLTRPVLAFSPDGTRIVYLANNRLYLRSMNDLEAKLISGVDATGNVMSPVFSPDGEWIAFWTGNEIKKIAVSGGVPVKIARAGIPYGITWSGDEILFGQANGANHIMRVSGNGGEPQVALSLKEGEVAYAPQRLPGGQVLLFTLATGVASDRWDKAQVVVQAPGSERKTLMAGTEARYLPTGHIVYAIGGVLYAVPFDLDRLQLAGDPVPVLEGVRRASFSTGAAHFSVSTTGSLAYVAGPASMSYAVSSLALIDRRGNIETLKVPPGPYEVPRISPDGKRIAFGSQDSSEPSIWIYDLSGVSSARRLTFGGRNRFPVWSADSQRVAFQSDRDGDLGIFWQRVDGASPAERLTRAEQGTSHVPEAWAPDGGVLLFDVKKGSSTSLWTFSLKERKTAPFDAVVSVTSTGAVFSPDGRWVAYASREQDQAVNNLLYVQPFPPTGVKYLVSNSADDGHHPAWARDGGELVFIPGPGRCAAIPVTLRPSFAFGTAVPVAKPFHSAGPSYERTFDVTPDGKRILGFIDSGLQSMSGSLTVPHIRVVLNWFDEVKARAPARRTSR